MADLSEQVRVNMQGLDDDALRKIVEVDFRNYTGEAVTFARQELGRRGQIRSPSPAQAGPGTPSEEAAPALRPALIKGARTWGAIFIVLAGVFLYTATFFGATLIAANQHGLRLKSEAPVSEIFYIALVGVFLWAGIKRRPRWELYFGITMAVIGLLLIIVRLNPAMASREIMREASLMAAVVCLAIGALFTVFGFARRRNSA